MFQCESKYHNREEHTPKRLVKCMLLQCVLQGALQGASEGHTSPSSRRTHDKKMIFLKIQLHNHFIKYNLLSKFGVSNLTMYLAGYEGGERKKE